ncbi:acyltransferase family protein [Schumannella soli]|nr:acyltransferase family protein [Schumannella soli]
MTPTPSARPAAGTDPRPVADTAAASRGLRGRLTGLDGLRAIAVTLVVVFHLAPIPVLPGGFLGVDVFFVISGFLITTLLLREHVRTGRIRLGAFWLRRARRLLPALVLLLLVCGAAAAAVGGDTLLHLGSQLLGAATFSSNWIFIAQGSSYFDAATPELFRNLWSLAVEEQFYLLWPLAVLLLVLLPRRVRMWIALALAAASAAAMWVIADPSDGTRAYYGTDTHSFGLALGSFLAFAAQGWAGDRALWSRARRAALGILGLLSIGALVALAILLPEHDPFVFRGGLLLAAVLTVVAIAAAVTPGSLLGRALDLAPLRWIGARSYGIYLWHWPVYLLLDAAAPTWPREGWSGWALSGAALAITLTAAGVSYSALEQPIRTDGFRRTARLVLGWWRWGASSATAATVVTVLALGAVAATGWAVTRDPGVGSTQSQVEAGQAAISATPSPSASPSASAAPPQGDRISVIGDSVTLAAATELQTGLPGVDIEAAVSRQMSVAPQLVQALKDQGRLRPIVVVALGTNGSLSRTTLDEVRRIIGPQRELVLVTAQAPRSWIDPNNAILTAYAQQYRNVELSNWHDAVQPHLDQLNRDQVHFGGAGARLFTQTLEEALQRLAQLPPLRGDRDYESAPRPV